MAGFVRDADWWARWSVCWVGLLLVAITLASILLAERPIIETLVLRGVIVGLAVGISLFGYWLGRTSEDADLVVRVAAWGLAVGALLTVLAGWAIASKLLLGQQSPSPNRYLLGGATVGFITGSVAGYYHEKSRRRAQELAAIRGQRLEVLASLLSHDLRSPLDVAYGRLRRVQQDLGQEHDDLAAIERSLDRIQDLIEDTMLLAGHGEAIEETEALSLRQFAQQCWATVETAEAELDVQSDLTFDADRARAASLFQNLFRNAIEHGGQDVTIEIGRCDDGFYVADDGPGIPIENRDRVFDLGYAVDDGRTGLGLSIVNEVAIEHGWEVAVTAGATGGARFEVTGVSVERSTP